MQPIQSRQKDTTEIAITQSLPVATVWTSVGSESTSSKIYLKQYVL